LAKKKNFGINLKKEENLERALIMGEAPRIKKSQYPNITPKG